MREPKGECLTLNLLLLWLGFFAGWTVGSVPLTLAGSDFAWLWLALCTGLIGSIMGWRARFVLQELLLVTPEIAAIPPSLSRRAILLILSGGVLILGATGFFILTSDARLLWGLTLCLAFLALLSSRQFTAATQPVTWRRQAAPHTPVLALFVAALWLAYVIALRPDADDAFYLNLPLGIIEASHGMLVWDTMYGAENWPLLGSNYRVEALQTLIAAIAWASGLPVAVVAHFVLPALWCLIWAGTLAVTGVGLFGCRWWMFALIAILSSLVFAGNLQSWGVHGLTRMFHGKAPLILIIIPLIFVITHRADVLDIPLHKAVPLLTGLICAAIGLTANAIYIAPLALGIAVSASWVLRGFRQPARLLALSAATPAVLVGLWLLLFDTPVTVPPVDEKTFAHLGLWSMFSDKLRLGLMALVILVALAACLWRPCAGFAAACLAMALVFVINPLLWPIYDRSVTGGLNFRLWWALPMPFLLAVLLTRGIANARLPAVSLPIIAAGLVLLSITPGGILGMSGTYFNPALSKRPPELMQTLIQIVDVAQDQKLLAVEDVAAWVPTLKGHPPQVYIRQIYLDQNRTTVAPQELLPRRILANWINAEGQADSEAVIAAFAAQCPRFILVAPDRLPQNFERILKTFGARKHSDLAGYRFYERTAGCDVKVPS